MSNSGARRYGCEPWLLLAIVSPIWGASGLVLHRGISEIPPTTASAVRLAARRIHTRGCHTRIGAPAPLMWIDGRSIQLARFDSSPTSHYLAQQRVTASIADGDDGLRVPCRTHSLIGTPWVRCGGARDDRSRSRFSRAQICPAILPWCRPPAPSRFSPSPSSLHPRRLSTARAPPAMPFS